MYSSANFVAVIDLPSLMGNDKDYLCTRVSYKLNLRGPSINVQTACSTSLVAVHLACQSLRRRETDIMLVGGVNLSLGATATLALAKAQMLSPEFSSCSASMSSAAPSAAKAAM